MAGYRAVQLFNLAVPADGEPVPALQSIGFPATFRITMAAIDPVQLSVTKAETNGAPAFIGSTLRIIRIPGDSDDEESDEEDSMDMADLLDDGSDEEESEDDEEINGGPSDPSKSPKAKRMAALKAALENGEDEDVEMNGDSTLTAKAKGKGKALDIDIDGMEDSDDESDVEGAEEFVLCTLDPSKSYQQTLDITINEHEMVYFSAMGSHDVFLTGNVLIPDDGPGRGQDMYDSDEDEDYDLEPDEDELDYRDAEDESDELDDLDDPRITELADDEDEDGSSPPQLVKTAAEVKKGKNKRAHEDSEIETPEKVTIDSTLNKALKPSTAAGLEEEEKPMTKSQLKKMRKKMKDNAGNPVDTTNGDVGTKVNETTPKSDKKVQFAKTLVQGPSGAAQPNGDIAKVKTEKKAVDGAFKVNGDAKSAATAKGERVVQGVTIDDRKLGSGPAAKKGDKVSMRYIGKLEKDKKVFDANKKGPPFTFKLGAGEVIKGWDIGIQGITVGGERRITVPAHLAYGSKSMADIPANSTLIFDVKCLEIK